MAVFSACAPVLVQQWALALQQHTHQWYQCQARDLLNGWSAIAQANPNTPGLYASQGRYREYVRTHFPKGEWVCVYATAHCSLTWQEHGKRYTLHTGDLCAP